MKVWIAFQQEDDEPELLGVYATPELAAQSLQYTSDPATTSEAIRRQKTYKWVEEYEVSTSL